MGKGKKGMVRFRLLFDDHRLLNNSQFSNGHGRYWLLLKPSIATFEDLASHLCNKFAISDRIVLCIGDFVLPPFESTCIIKDEDIIRVKQKNVKLKDACKPCDIQNIVQDSEIASAYSLTFNSHINTGEKSQGNPQENVMSEHAAHDCGLSIGIFAPKQKGVHSPKLDNSISKRQKFNSIENEDMGVGVQVIHSRKNGKSCDIGCGSKMEFHGEANTHNHGLLATESGAGVNLDEQVPASSMTCEERHQPERINKGLEYELHTVCGVTKECGQVSCATNRREPNQLSKKSLKGKDCYDWLNKRPQEDSSDKIVKTDMCKIDFASIFPLTRSPSKGDILAYRYVEPLSAVYPVLSSPQVGEVSAFDSKSSVIVLVKAPEFEVFSEENSDSLMLMERVSPYKEDGSLEIKLSELFDVRLLRAHDSKDLACLPEGTLNRIKKDNWEVASAKSNGRESGVKYFSTTERASTSWIYGESPAAALFWETILSKGTFGKARACSSGGKF